MHLWKPRLCAWVKGTKLRGWGQEWLKFGSWDSAAWLHGHQHQRKEGPRPRAAVRGLVPGRPGHGIRDAHGPWLRGAREGPMQFQGEGQLCDGLMPHPNQFALLHRPPGLSPGPREMEPEEQGLWLPKPKQNALHLLPVGSWLADPWSGWVEAEDS